MIRVLNDTWRLPSLVIILLSLASFSLFPLLLTSRTSVGRRRCCRGQVDGGSHTSVTDGVVLPSQQSHSILILGQVN